MLSCDWLAQKLILRFYSTVADTDISAHQSDEFLRERFKSYVFEISDPVISNTPCMVSH